MQFPERPTCHDSDWQAQRFKKHLVWRDAKPDSRFPKLPFEPLRTCGYCGSIHPHDLLIALERGAILSGSDWKYGWPHKFYINIPNPYGDEQAEIGGKSYWDDKKGERVYEPTYGAAGDYYAKWYNQHLLDAGFDDEALATLFERLMVASGIEFRLNEGKLQYHAPHHGYQR